MIIDQIILFYTFLSLKLYMNHEFQRFKSKKDHAVKYKVHGGPIVSPSECNGQPKLSLK